MMKKLGILMTILILTSLIGCGKKEEEKKSEKVEKKKIEVVTTTGMIADIVKNIGGDAVNVTALMGPGVDPHTYKASAGDVGKMANADVIFYNGLHLEGAMSEVFERMSGEVRAVAVTDRIMESHLLESPQFEGAFDPHVWFDVRVWMMAVELVRDILIEYDRGAAVMFDNNTEGYLTELSELHDYVYKLTKSVPERQRVLITAHDAFSYFGRAYGFEVRGLQGISTASEAGTADVQNLAQFIVDHKIPAIFVESSVSPKSIEAVQAAVAAKGFKVKIGGKLFSDAMGNPGTFEGTYIGMVTYNVETIANALSAGKEPQPRSR
ncbi:MAG: zinc ABC transporter substrate-binding protein [Candidatus Zixiibacteriota bacterium]